ncbi:hypothetical protein ACKAV7_003490 [Fusarium commune]
MALPVDDTADTPVSLSQPAPAGPIPTTAWHAYFSYGIGHLDYSGLLEQRNPCIRSLRYQRTVKNKFFLQAPAAGGMPQLSSNYEITESATFPYPKTYQEVMFPLNPIPRHDEEHGAADSEISPTQHDPRQAQAERIEWKTSFSTPVFGVTRTSAIEFESRIQPTYVVLGLFLRGNPNPKERVVFVDKPDQLFSKLRWATFRLQGEYGLELVLDWSVTRISIVVLVPVLLSLAIGIWLNSKAWTDLATIQTAWGTASYIVTAGASTAANLEQKYQLIIVGLMLSLMDLCTGKLSTIAFLQLETRWASLSQNYDSIIKKTVLGSLLNWRRGSQRWTLLLSASLAFPLLLSIGYKTFVGGRITTEVHASGGQYGLTGPVGFAKFTSGSALMVNATIPFIFNNVTKLSPQPQPFGFNMLLLKNDNIAVTMLDGPSPSYVKGIRAELQGQQSYTVCADVFGLAWHLDTEVEKQRENTTWWNDLYETSDDEAPQNISLYKEEKCLSTLWPQGQVDQFFVLVTPHESNRKIKPSKERFLLSDFVSDLLTDKLDEAAQIRFTAVVSSLLWSRLAAFCGIGSPVNDLSSNDRKQFEYHRPDEAWKTVTVLRGSLLLAIVLLAQPTVGFVLLIVRIAFCSSPVSGGFGLISVLSGNRSNESDILSGAGLSGDAKERIELAFDRCGEPCDDGGEIAEGFQKQIVLRSVGFLNESFLDFFFLIREGDKRQSYRIIIIVDVIV